MKIDPWARDEALRPALEVLTREQLQHLQTELTAELMRRAFKREEEDEIKKRNQDVPRHGRIGW